MVQFDAFQVERLDVSAWDVAVGDDGRIYYTHNYMDGNDRETGYLYRYPGERLGDDKGLRLDVAPDGGVWHMNRTWGDLPFGSRQPIYQRGRSRPVGGKGIHPKYERHGQLLR